LQFTSLVSGTWFGSDLYYNMISYKISPNTILFSQTPWRSLPYVKTKRVGENIEVNKIYSCCVLPTNLSLKEKLLSAAMLLLHCHEWDYATMELDLVFRNTLSRISHFLSRIFCLRIFISHLALSYLASRIFISHLAFLSRIYLQNCFSFPTKSHLECSFQASVDIRYYICEIWSSAAPFHHDLSCLRHRTNEQLSSMFCIRKNL